MFLIVLFTHYIHEIYECFTLQLKHHVSFTKYWEYLLWKFRGVPIFLFSWVSKTTKFTLVVPKENKIPIDLKTENLITTNSRIHKLLFLPQSTIVGINQWKYFHSMIKYKINTCSWKMKKVHCIDQIEKSP